MTKSKNLTIRLSDSTAARLASLTSIIPYAISVTSIVERGIELAADELEVLAKASAEHAGARKRERESA